MNNAAKKPPWKEFMVSTDPDRVDLDLVYRFLTHSYWAEDIPEDIVVRSIQHSLCFGAYLGNQQIGFARVITDQATYAYLADVFVVEEYRGHGVASALMEAIMAHPALQGLRRWSLLTRDAHELYRRFGFTEPRRPERSMEIAHPDIYKKLRKKDSGHD